ncbi:MAG: glycosyltransferase family 4 protein [Alphaproteobacteria bacterium]|nr:glycosyltransferase family 4 protein [Alphaproteobacteria bacterium]
MSETFSIAQRFGGRSTPPTILQVLPALETGGVERGTVDMAKAMAEAGWTPLVASAGGPMVRELDRAGVEHIELPVDSKNPIRMRINADRLTDLCYARQVDIIHARSRAPAWPALWAARRRKIPFVTTFHGTYGHSNALKRLYNSVMVRGDRVIAVSHFIADHIAQVYHAEAKKVRIIPRGIDLTVFDPDRTTAERMIRLSTEWQLPDGMPIVMLPGRLTGWKGQTVLIEAMAKLKDRGVLALLVGSDQGREAYSADLHKLIKDRDLQGKVRLVGDCRDMAAAYKLSDVVVSASTEPEAFGRVAVEGQAMGRTVVATQHGGATETVQHGKTGFLVTPGDADALAETIAKALDMDDAARTRMRDAARRHAVKVYDKQLMAMRTLAVYEELLEGPS